MREARGAAAKAKTAEAAARVLVASRRVARLAAPGARRRAHKRHAKDWRGGCAIQCSACARVRAPLLLLLTLLRQTRLVSETWADPPFPARSGWARGARVMSSGGVWVCGRARSAHRSSPP